MAACTASRTGAVTWTVLLQKLHGGCLFIGTVMLSGWCFWACSAHLLSSDGIARTTSALDMLRSKSPLPTPVAEDLGSCSKDLCCPCLGLLTGLQAHTLDELPVGHEWCCLYN